MSHEPIVVIVTKYITYRPRFIGAQALFLSALDIVVRRFWKSGFIEEFFLAYAFLVDYMIKSINQFHIQI